jgi:hypothetical protein
MRIRTNHDTKWRRWFAWFPTQISDDQDAWLEWIEYRYAPDNPGYWECRARGAKTSALVSIPED